MNLKFDLSPRKILGIAMALLVVLLVCAYKVNTNPSGISLTGVIFASVALAVLALFAKIDVGVEVLRSELEPKVGYAPHASPPVEPYPQRPHRYDLEHALVHALSPGLVSRMGGKEIGEYIRTATDAILSGGLPSAKSLCTCGPNQGCIACASSGAQADRTAEAEILDKGLTAPRVTAEQVQALMNKLTWRYEHEAGSRHTFAHAFLGDFYIATGHNAPISRENFNAELGMKYAREQAEGKARDKLWELEGYKLMRELKGEQA